MCRAVNCKKCGMTTWAGCGQHVDQVMRNVPRANRCPGHTPQPGDTRTRTLTDRLLGRNR